MFGAISGGEKFEIFCFIYKISGKDLVRTTEKKWKYNYKASSQTGKSIYGKMLYFGWASSTTNTWSGKMIHLRSLREIEIVNPSFNDVECGYVLISGGNSVLLDKITNEYEILKGNFSYSRQGIPIIESKTEVLFLNPIRKKTDDSIDFETILNGKYITIKCIADIFDEYHCCIEYDPDICPRFITSIDSLYSNIKDAIDGANPNLTFVFKKDKEPKERPSFQTFNTIRMQELSSEKPNSSRKELAKIIQSEWQLILSGDVQYNDIYLINISINEKYINGELKYTLRKKPMDELERLGQKVNFIMDKFC